ncbi:Uncharacterized protein SCF082_LOCUS38254 [Durusdinium trenchii]
MMQDEQVQELYEQIPKVSARHPHVLEFELGFATAADAFAVEGLRTSLEIAPMQKLSHKVLQDDFFLALLHPLSKPTLLSVLCSNGRIDAELRDIGDVAEHSELLLVEERHKKKVHSSWQFSVQTLRHSDQVKSSIFCTMWSSGHRFLHRRIFGPAC